MKTWTEDATAQIESYLRQVQVLLEDDGADAHEVVDDLRNHILEQGEVSANVVITADEAKRVLAQMGTPAEVAATWKEMGGEDVWGAPHLSQPMKKGVSWKPWHAVVLVAVFAAGGLLVSVMRDEGSVDNLESVGTGVSEPRGTDKAASAPAPIGARTYKREEVAAHDMPYFLQRIGASESGYHNFAAMWAAILKLNATSVDQRAALLQQVLDAVADTDSPFDQRFQCIYVASSIEDEHSIPVIERVLSVDPNPTLRGVAACALGHFTSPAAHDALQRAQATEKDPEVLSWIGRALAGDFPRPKLPEYE